MTTNDAHEIVRYLQDGDRERDLPCVVGGEAEPCERPAAMEVYGLVFCEEHGEEAKDGALEEMHQNAHDFFGRFDTPFVPQLDNPLVRAAVAHWGRTVPAGLEYSEGRADELLLRAFPFRADRVDAGTACAIADPIPDQGHPHDWWRHDRHQVHAIMRAAHQRGMTWLVEMLEAERESIAAQCAYALALDRGDHPEVLERAHRENIEAARKVGERMAHKPPA